MARQDPTRRDDQPQAGEPAAGTALACRGLTHLYGDGGGDGVVALDDVTLTFAPGELTVVAGPSGSGKSTLLHVLALLQRPSGGTVHLGETEVVGLDDRARRRLRRDRVGVVFQRFHLLPALSARANVALPLIERGVSKRDRRARATELLEDVGLGDRISHRPGQLSGGEKQRVAVARALATDPDVIVADEPTGELDTETGRRVLALLERVAADRVVVVASHDPRVVEAADRVVNLLDGRVHDDA